MSAKKMEPRILALAGVTGLGLTVLLAGCGSAVDLSDLPSPALNVRLPGCRECVGLELTFTTDPSDCPTLASSTRATLNGHELELIDPGGMGPGLGPLLRSCHQPLFTSPLTSEALGLDQESSRIEFKGGGKTLVMEGLSLDAERTLRWAGSGAPDIHAGQQVALALSVATDTLDIDTSSVSFISETGRPGDSFIVGGEQLTYESGILRFTAPPSLDSGRGALSVSATLLPQVTRCEGLASCTVRRSTTLSLPGVTVGP